MANDKWIAQGGGVDRAPSLGQVDEEFDYGPQTLAPRDVPIDLRQRRIKQWVDPNATAPVLPNGAQDLTGLIKDMHALAGVAVLRRGLIGRVESITNVPKLIINQQEEGGRGFLLLNPAGVVGLTSKGVLVPSQQLVGATTLQSASLGVANYKTAKLFINATFNAGAGPVTFDIESLDPVTGTVQFISQTLSMTTTGQLYANLGTLGIDTDLSVLITVPVGTTITVAIGFVLKDGLDGTSSGVTQTIFVGPSGVSSVAGYPLLSGKERPFYVMENVQLWAVTAGPTLNMNIFEL